MPQYKFKREGVLQLKEVEEMIAKAGSNRDKCLISMLYIAGGRITEILELRRKDIWVDGKYLNIDVRIQKRRGEKKFIIQKRHVLKFNVETTPLIDHITRWVQPIIEPEGLVFNISRTWAWRILKKLNPLSCCHLFRHTRVTKLREAGVEGTDIVVWMGWSDTRPLKKYFHAEPQVIQEMADKIR